MPLQSVSPGRLFQMLYAYVFCLVELSAVAHFPGNSIGLNSTLIVRSIQVEFTNITNISDAFCIRF